MDTLTTASAQETLPLRALLAYAVRCARRVQPLYSLPSDHPQADDCRKTVDTAIRVAQELAAGISPDPETVATTSEAIIQALVLAGETRADDRRAAFAANAAYAVIDAAQDALESIHNSEAIERVVASVGIAYDSAVSAEPRVREEARRDRDRLVQLALGTFPETGEAVDPSESGPLGPLFADRPTPTSATATHSFTAGTTVDNESEPPADASAADGSDIISPPPLDASTKKFRQWLRDFKRKYAQLARDREQIDEERLELARRREELERNQSALEDEKACLAEEQASRNEEQAEHRERLQTEQQALQERQQELDRTQEAFEVERAAFQKQTDEWNNDLAEHKAAAELETQRAQLAEERRQIEQQQQQCRQRQEQVDQDQDQLHPRREELERQQAALDDEQTRLHEAISTLEEERAELLERMEAKQASLRVKQQELASTQEAFEIERAAFQKQTDEWNDHLAEREKATADLEAERSQLAEQRQQIEQQQEQCRQRQEQLDRKAEDLSRDREELEQRQSALADQETRLSEARSALEKERAKQQERLQAGRKTLETDRQELVHARETFEIEQAAFREQTETFHAGLAEFEETAAELEVQRAQIVKQQQQIKRQRKECRQRKQQIEQDENRLLREQEQFQENQKRLAEALAESQRESADLVDRRQQLDAEWLRMKRNKLRFRDLTDLLNEERAALADQRRQDDRQRDEFNAQRKKLRARVAELETRKNELRTQLDSFRNQQNQLLEEKAACARKEAEIHKAISHLQDEGGQLRKETATVPHGVTEIATIDAIAGLWDLVGQLQEHRREIRLLRAQRAGEVKRAYGTQTPETTPAGESEPAERRNSAFRPVRILLDPGLATEMQLAELFNELSGLYRQLGGPGVRFTVTDCRSWTGPDAWADGAAQVRHVVDVHGTVDVAAGADSACFAPDLWNRYLSSLLIPLAYHSELVDLYERAQPAGKNDDAGQTVSAAAHRAATAYAAHNGSAVAGETCPTGIDGVTRQLRRLEVLLRRLADEQHLTAELAVPEASLDAPPCPAVEPDGQPSRSWWTSKPLWAVIAAILVVTAAAWFCR